MSTATPPLGTAITELPATAPHVRITAGAGSAGQKTWNLRRPVTIIGSRRPAQIILHDRSVSKAHCVIVNTGSDVLLKDLHTTGGTLCNNTRIDLITLQDGDVIRIGTMNIQVAIQMPTEAGDDSGCGMVYVDPTQLGSPVVLMLDHTERNWTSREAVALIGNHPSATITLEHPVVARRHAVLFKFNNGPAVFSLGAPGGLAVNGTLCTAAMLHSGDRLGIGPCTLVVNPDDGSHTPTPARASTDGTPSAPLVRDDAVVKVAAGTYSPAASDGNGTAPHARTRSSLAADHAVNMADKTAPPNGRLDARSSSRGPDGLETDIAESWKRINYWSEDAAADGRHTKSTEKDLTAREAELDERDASLRGILHDVTRYQKEVAEHEAGIAAQRAEIKAERLSLATVEAECARREADIARRTAELKRREHVLAQRWARLLAATCPHCGEPIRVDAACSGDAPPPPGE